MLYKVLLPNDFYKVGAVLEDDDSGMVQEVSFWTENGRMMTGGYKGIMIPLEKVRPYVFAILRRGFDDQGAHAKYRGAYRHRDLRSESRRMEDQVWEEFSSTDPEFKQLAARRESGD